MVIIVPLFELWLAIPAISVRPIDKPKLPNKIARRNKGRFRIGEPDIAPKIVKFIIDRINRIMKL